MSAGRWPLAASGARQQGRGGRARTQYLARPGIGRARPRPTQRGTASRERERGPSARPPVCVLGASPGPRRYLALRPHPPANREHPPAGHRVCAIRFMDRNIRPLLEPARLCAFEKGAEAARWADVPRRGRSLRRARGVPTSRAGESPRHPQAAAGRAGGPRWPRSARTAVYARARPCVCVPVFFCIFSRSAGEGRKEAPV